MPYEPYMLTICRGCSKQVPALCCSAYLDPSVLIWVRQDKTCPVNSRVDKTPKQEKFVNPLKRSKREAK